MMFMPLNRAEGLGDQVLDLSLIQEWKILRECNPVFKSSIFPAILQSKILVGASLRPTLMILNNGIFHPQD